MKFAYPWQEWVTNTGSRHARADSEGDVLVYVIPNTAQTGWLVKSYLDSDSYYIKHGPYPTVEEAKIYADSLLAAKEYRIIEAKLVSMI
jgi:hypothetical protein